MAYTDVWDVTTPLDTQAANQGAVDFRATKLDIMQRVASFGAGLLAARPTPETTGATADWTGVTYLATDTKQLFRWSGAAWVDISSSTPGASGSVVFSSANVIAAPAGVGVNPIYSGTVSASAMGTTGGVRIGFQVNGVGNPGNYTITVTLGGQVVFGSSTISENVVRAFDIFIQNYATGNQATRSIMTPSGSASLIPFLTSLTTVDTTVDQLLVVNIQKSVGTDAWNLANGFAKIV